MAVPVSQSFSYMLIIQNNEPLGWLTNVTEIILYLSVLTI